MEKSKDKPYAQKLIPLIVIMVVVYALVDFVLQFTFQIELSPTLTTCWFAFWGTEILSLASIKIGKTIKKGDINNDSRDVY